MLVNKTFTNVQTVWAMYTEHNRTDTRYIYYTFTIHVYFSITCRPTNREPEECMEEEMKKMMRYKMETHWTLLMKWMMISTCTCTHIHILTYTCTCTISMGAHTSVLNVNPSTCGDIICVRYTFWVRVSSSYLLRKKCNDTSELQFSVM